MYVKLPVSGKRRQGISVVCDGFVLFHRSSLFLDEVAEAGPNFGRDSDYSSERENV